MILPYKFENYQLNTIFLARYIKASNICYKSKVFRKKRLVTLTGHLLIDLCTRIPLPELDACGVGL